MDDSWYFLEIFILTDSSSSDEDEENTVTDVAIAKVHQRFTCGFTNVVDELSDQNFRKHFRMNKITFEFLLNLLEGRISTTGESGRNTIEAKTQLLFTIWYFATPDSYRSICSRFNIGSATGYRTVHRVTDALLKLAPKFIRWPTGEYVDEVRRKFSEKGFPNVIGCIDGCYIPIPMPKEEGRAYITRKNFAAITLQGVCDHRRLFTHCYAGEVGSVHDAKVLKNSEIWLYMHENNVEMFPDNVHLLGDKAYPISPQLMVLYKDNGHLTRRQKEFNYRLSSVRSTIERTFGLLKKRFRTMKFLDVRTVKWIPKYILACCVLHNICILQNDDTIFDDDDGDNEYLENQDVDFDENVNEGRVRRLAGMEKRDAIAQNM